MSFSYSVQLQFEKLEAHLVFNLTSKVDRKWGCLHIFLKVFHPKIFSTHFRAKEISIFSNSSHFKWRAGLSDTILKGDHQRTIPAKFALIWFSGFRGEDLNVIFYQNMPNLHNRYKLAEWRISQKKTEYTCMLNYSLPCSCS